MGTDTQRHSARSYELASLLRGIMTVGIGVVMALTAWNLSKTTELLVAVGKIETQIAGQQLQINQNRAALFRDIHGSNGVIQ